MQPVVLSGVTHPEPSHHLHLVRHPKEPEHPDKWQRAFGSTPMQQSHQADADDSDISLIKARRRLLAQDDRVKMGHSHPTRTIDIDRSERQGLGRRRAKRASETRHLVARENRLFPVNDVSRRRTGLHNHDRNHDIQLVIGSQALATQTPRIHADSFTPPCQFMVKPQSLYDVSSDHYATHQILEAPEAVHNNLVDRVLPSGLPIQLEHGGSAHSVDGAINKPDTEDDNSFHWALQRLQAAAQNHLAPLSVSEFPTSPSPFRRHRSTINSDDHSVLEGRTSLPSQYKSPVVRAVFQDQEDQCEADSRWRNYVVQNSDSSTKTSRTGNLGDSEYIEQATVVAPTSHTEREDPDYIWRRFVFGNDAENNEMAVVGDPAMR